jgi:hypothetical protein
VVRVLQADGMSQNEIHCRLVSVYGQNICSQEEMSVWHIKFNDG